MPSTQHFSTKLRKFCETTSVRGVPRLIKARSGPIRAVWALAVLACAALLGWQLTLVLTRYVQFFVTLVLVQAPAWQRPSFPDITVCNLNPLIYQDDFPIKYDEYINWIYRFTQLSENGHAIKGSLEYPNFFISLYNYSQGPNGKQISLQTQTAFGMFMPLPLKYVNQFPLQEESLSLKGNDTPIVDCSYFSWSGEAYNTSCMDMIQAVWDPTYYKCFTLRLNEKDLSDVKQLSAVIYVQEFNSNSLTLHTLKPGNSYASGMRVLAHAPGTAPDMSLGMSISPGLETSVTLSQTTRRRLGRPYSNCTDEQRMKADTAIYTQDYYVSTCVQQEIIDSCGCVSLNQQNRVSQLRHVNFTVCGNISRDDVFQTFLCAADFQADLGPCSSRCFAPCSEYSYEMRSSAASWSQLSALMPFYNTFIVNKSRFGNKFDAFRFVRDNWFNTSAATEGYLQSFYDSGLIQNSFLQLNELFGSPRFNVLQDAAAFSVDAMGAQIGGVLNLWLGVTVMFLFEVFEFLVTVLTNRRRKVKESSCPA